MNQVTLCLGLLFDILSNGEKREKVNTEYGYIEKEVFDKKEYFDFKDSRGTPCEDGETCEILEENDKFVLLQEPYERLPFKMSRKEFDTAAVLLTA